MSCERVGPHLFLAINKQNNMQTTPPKTHIAFIMPHPKGIGSFHTRDNRYFKFKDNNSKSNELSSPVIPMPSSLNDSVINPPQLSSVFQHSSRYSQNTTPESQDSLISGRNSADPSNTMLPPPTKNRSQNIYECMVDVPKLTPAQRKHHAIILLQYYHELCNTNDPSSMFVSPPPTQNTESLYQSTISALGSGSFVRNRADANI